MIGNVIPACAFSCAWRRKKVKKRAAYGWEKKTVKNWKSKSPNRWKLAFTPPFFRSVNHFSPTLVIYWYMVCRQPCIVACGWARALMHNLYSLSKLAHSSPINFLLYRRGHLWCSNELGIPRLWPVPWQQVPWSFISPGMPEHLHWIASGMCR